MKPKLHVRHGDTVQVMTGASSGARGRIIRVDPSKGRVVVEGVNMVWKHLKRSRERPRGERVEMEAPLHASNVMLVCPNRDCKRYDRGVRVRKVIREDGRKARLCAVCSAEIPRSE
jgi:large subunit ribosomal protein L24